MAAQHPDEASGERAIHAVLDFAAVEGDDFSLAIQPRPGTRVVRLDSTLARQVRDLAGAIFDMKRVAALCRQYVAAMAGESPEVVQDALWMTAIVLYARCFNGGVRQPLNRELLAQLPGQAREAHDHFIDLRDKFVAHSVNAYEQTLPYAVLRLEGNELDSTGTAHLWANPMSQEGAETLERLVWAFYNDAMRQKALLGAALYDETEAMTDEELGRLPDLAVETPNVERGHRRRK